MFRYKHHHYHVYIVTNLQRSTLYTGVTNNLPQRLTEHWLNRGNKKSFAGKYFCYNLIYYEYFTYVLNAVKREKEIKGWDREQKERLISYLNPRWRFLNNEFCKEWPPKDGERRSG